MSARPRAPARPRRLTLRFTEREWGELQRAAEKAGESPAEYAAWAAVVAAREELGIDPLGEE